MSACVFSRFEAKKLGFFEKNEKDSKSKNLFPGKKIFFALKSFLNDFKAILRVIFFVAFFGGGKFALEKNKKITRKRQKTSKNGKNFKANFSTTKKSEKFFCLQNRFKI